MVPPVTATAQGDTAVGRDSALVVELVGLAGAGKTTLARALCRRDPRIRVADDIQLRNCKHLLMATRDLPRLIHPLLAYRSSITGLTWQTLKDMIYLTTWSRFLAKHAASDAVLLLDQGPIFRLATLHTSEPERFAHGHMAFWWHAMLRQWAAIVDIIVWLHAPEPVLIERINIRQKQHVVKNTAVERAYAFLQHYRASYELTLMKLAAGRGPIVLQVDTSGMSVDRVVEDMLTHFQKARASIQDEERTTCLYSST